MKDNLKQIQLTKDYMKQNLKTELTVQELSDMAGFILVRQYLDGTVGNVDQLDEHFNPLLASYHIAAQ